MTRDRLWDSKFDPIFNKPVFLHWMSFNQKKDSRCAKNKKANRCLVSVTWPIFRSIFDFNYSQPNTISKFGILFNDKSFPSYFWDNIQPNLCQTSEWINSVINCTGKKPIVFMVNWIWGPFLYSCTSHCIESNVKWLTNLRLLDECVRFFAG